MYKLVYADFGNDQTYYLTLNVEYSYILYLFCNGKAPNDFHYLGALGNSNIKRHRWY